MNAAGLRTLVFLVLTLSYPVTSFLWRHSYPWFAAEVVAIYLAIVLAALALTVLFAGIRPPLAHSLCALMVVLAVTVQFDLKFIALVVLIAALAVLVSVTRERFVSFGIPVIAAMTVGAFFDAGADPTVDRAEPGSGPSATSRPPVIHIMLDSMIGLDGIPDHPAAAFVREQMIDFFTEFGFSVFSRSYSRYTHTGDSVYSAFNFTHGADSIYQWEALGRLEHVLRSNRYFDQLAARGYRFRIFQTEHIDFCQFDPAVVDLCRTYLQPNARSVRAIGSVVERVRVLTTLVASQSTLVRDAGPRVIFGRNLGVAMHDPKIFQQLGRSLETAGEGNVHFAHVLLPHGPYAFRSDCSLDYGNDILERYASKMDEPVPGDALIEKRNGLFLEQVQCAIQSLRALLLPLQANGVLERSLVIVHGDHGSTVARRMARKEFRAMLGPQDYRSHYSTLFALKYPGGSFQLVDNTVSLGTLFEHLAATMSVSESDWNDGGAFNFHWRAGNVPVDETYVYLSGTYPLLRVDLDIFQHAP